VCLVFFWLSNTILACLIHLICCKHGQVDITELKCSGVGCHLYSEYFVCIVCADDIFAVDLLNVLNFIVVGSRPYENITEYRVLQCTRVGLEFQLIECSKCPPSAWRYLRSVRIFLYHFPIHSPYFFTSLLNFASFT